MLCFVTVLCVCSNCMTFPPQCQTTHTKHQPPNPTTTKTKIEVLLVDGVYYGFSGCHRFEAHQRLGLTRIRCRVMGASKETLRMHLM